MLKIASHYLTAKGCHRLSVYKNTISTFAFSLLQYVVLVEVCREDCASLRFVVEKEKSLFRKLWIVFFDTTPKLNKCKFLKVQLWCGIWSYTNKLFILLHYCSILHFERIFLLMDDFFFLTSCIGYLENTDSLSYTDLPNVVFHYTVFLKITVISLSIPSWKL